MLLVREARKRVFEKKEKKEKKKREKENWFSRYVALLLNVRILLLYFLHLDSPIY